jgi:hypothetical protein
MAERVLVERVLVERVLVQSVLVERVAGMFCWMLLAVFLAACSARPPSATVPGAFDLTGAWALVPGESDSPPTTLQLRARGGMLHLVAQDFPVLNARRMNIEQDPQSMGISYDGGAWRDVSWGARKRGLWEVQAGWLDGQLVILSKAEDADARETFQLGPDGRILTVIVNVRSGGEQLIIRRTFSRV